MDNTKLPLKLTALAGVAATTTQAAVTLSPTVGSGITFGGVGTHVNWDVDGDSTSDFELWRTTTSSGSHIYGLFDDLNGGRLVVPDALNNSGIGKLSNGFAVGPAMTGFKFHSSSQVGNDVTSAGLIGGDAKDSGWADGDTGFFGFKFTNVTGTHYGWGELTFGGPGDFTINQAYFENIPDTAITVGSTTAIPEPASAAALLGLGAAGIAAWRRRRAA